MALVLRKAVLPRNVSLLKCIKGRSLASSANKNTPAPLSNIAKRRSLMEHFKALREMRDPTMRIKQVPLAKTEKHLDATSVMHKSVSCPCLTTATEGFEQLQIPSPTLPRSQSAVFSETYCHGSLAHTHAHYPRVQAIYDTPPNTPHRQYPSLNTALASPNQSRGVTYHSNVNALANHLCSICGCPGPCSCCLPGPCSSSPKCVQNMTGYYYYPYGNWFCGPYHSCVESCPCKPCETCGPSKICGPCGPCGPCNLCAPCGPCGPCNVYAPCGPLKPPSLSSRDSQPTTAPPSDSSLSSCCCFPMPQPYECSKYFTSSPLSKPCCSRPCGPCSCSDSFNVSRPPSGLNLMCAPCGPCSYVSIGPCGPWAQCQSCGTYDSGCSFPCSGFARCSACGALFNCGIDSANMHPCSEKFRYAQMDCYQRTNLGNITPYPCMTYDDFCPRTLYWAQPQGTCPQFAAISRTTGSSQATGNAHFTASYQYTDSKAATPCRSGSGSTSDLNPKLVRTYPFNKPKPKLHQRTASTVIISLTRYLSTKGDGQDSQKKNQKKTTNEIFEKSSSCTPLRKTTVK